MNFESEIDPRALGSWRRWWILASETEQVSILFRELDTEITKMSWKL